MTMHRTLYPGDDVDRLYVSRKEGGRELTSFDDSVDTSIRGLENYIKKQRRTNCGNQYKDKQNNNNWEAEIKKTTTTVWLYQATNWRNLTQEDLDMLHKGNFKWEIEPLLIISQNNSIRMNYTQAKINNMSQSRKCRLYGDWDETIIHIISEYSKLAPGKYKTRQNLVGKVIYWESCQKFKFDHITNLPGRMRRKEFSGILRYNLIS